MLVRVKKLRGAGPPVPYLEKGLPHPSLFDGWDSKVESILERLLTHHFYIKTENMIL